MRHGIDQRVAQRLRFGAQLGAAQVGGEPPGHGGDDEEQGEVHRVLRVADAEAVQRRIEQERRDRDAGERGDDRRQRAPARRRHQHRNEEQAGDRFELHHALDPGDDERRESDEDERPQRRHGLLAQLRIPNGPDAH